MLAAAIPFPNISPEVFSISLGGFEFALRWYALAYIAGILGGWWLAVRAVRSGHLWAGSSAPMTRTQVDDLVTWIIIGIIAGGRLGYVLFYDLDRYLAVPGDIVKVWQGGMAFHGGLLGVAAAIMFFSLRNKVALLSVSDVLALTVPPGLLLGRIANFINAELWGRDTDLPWGVIFPGQAAQTCAGQAFGECARHPSQLYEAGMEGLILGGVLLWLAFKGGGLKRPGLLTGVYLTGYGIARFIVEFVRVADAQFISPDNPAGSVALGMSMGQLLSLPMVLAGIVLIAVARRRADAAA